MTKYLAMISVLIMFVVAGIYFALGGGKLPVDFPRGIPHAQFDIDQLVGEWKGPGIVYLPDSSAMTLEARVSFESISDSSFETSTILSGHQFHYSDHGRLSLFADSSEWLLTGMNDEQMDFRGWLANDILFVKYQSGKIEYKMQLYFRTPTRLYVAQELYKDSTRESWFEYTLEPR